MTGSTRTGDRRRYVIVGVDPGRTCGIVRFTWFSGAPIMGTADVESLECGWMDCCGVVEGIMPTANDSCSVVLAVERYTEGRGRARTAQPEALMTIGALAWISERARQRVNWHGRGDVRLVLQGAADASRAGNRETLRQVGWWQRKDPEQHRNRAAAQVALTMLTLFPNEWSQLLDRGRVNT